MTALQVVTEKVAEVIKLAAGFLAQAAAGLLSKAETLSVDEMSRRLDGALRALRGEDLSTSGAVATAQKTSLEIAQEMVNSYKFDKKTRVSTFTVPAGVTDVEAMKALNEYFREHLPNFNRGAVFAGDLDWYENLPKKYPTHCQERNYSQARQITITGLVKGTKGENRTTQGTVLTEGYLVFSDPRDQAIAAALHACNHDGDLFKYLWVRGSVPGFALSANLSDGVYVHRYDVDDDHYSNVAASGSPSPELQ